jgi:translation initiation factor 2 beta subunit (eIF-2beta)/eIF-5
MRISKKYSTDDWKALKFDCESDWKTGIDIFIDRIESRFLDMVDLIEHETYAGFSVMALDCLLIETLEQFYKGEKETPAGQSGQYFIDFLTRSPFKEYFDDDMAKAFFKKIRCGILHQAEIKDDSRILIREGIPLVKKGENGGLIIQRKLFHEQLVKAFNEYIELLQDPKKDEPRRKFKIKMDLICQLDRTEEGSK